MDMLYAPWRQKYTAGPARGPQSRDGAPQEECVFCNQIKEDKDDHYFILGRYKHNYVILNRYPYNGGHLLILPMQHYAKLTELESEAQIELMMLISKSCEFLEKELEAKGINVGLNMGKAAGAGMPSHLHFHVLPRWLGDTNFLPTLGNTKTVSTDLEDLFKRLKPYFTQLN